MKNRRAFTLVELLVVLAILTTVIGLILPAIQRVRGAYEKLRCQSNLHQLGVALHHYHGDHHRFPPGVTRFHSIDELERAADATRAATASPSAAPESAPPGRPSAG